MTESIHTNFTLSCSMTDNDVMLIVLLLSIYYCKAIDNYAHMHLSSVQHS